MLDSRSLDDGSSHSYQYTPILLNLYHSIRCILPHHIPHFLLLAENRMLSVGLIEGYSAPALQEEV